MPLKKKAEPEAEPELKTDPEIPKSQAYENARKLREHVRQLYRMSYDYGDSMHLANAIQNTDMYLNAVKGEYQGLLRQALQMERKLSSKSPHAAFTSYIRLAYDLVQKIPSYEEMPDGEMQNKLRAIEALIKAKKGKTPDLTINAIAMMLDPTGTLKAKATPPVPKPKAPKKQPVIKFDTPMPEDLPPNTPPGQSSLHLVSVKKDYDGWGFKAKFKFVPDGTPMTWGSCITWVDKGLHNPESFKPNAWVYLPAAYKGLVAGGPLAEAVVVDQNPPF